MSLRSIINREHLSQTDPMVNSDYQVCRQIMAKASKNYSFASFFLPNEILPHVEALYAFLRVGDDRVDVSYQEFDSPDKALENWENLYWKVFETGSSPHPVIRAYYQTAMRYNIPADLMAPYFKSMWSDLKVNHYSTFRDLMVYMEGSALPVGRAMTYILGIKKPFGLEETLAGADNLSIAMQLSNFWRDIGEDYFIRNRIYIPLEDLESFKYSLSDIQNKNINQNFINLLEFEFSRTEKYYQAARQAIRMLDRGTWGVYCGLEIYRDIIRSIRTNKYDVYHQRAGANLIRKVLLVLKSRILTL